MPKRSPFQRVYKHYEELEEYHAGMWRIVRGQERKRFIAEAAILMRNADDFKAAMQRAITEWPTSCAVNLTADAVNKIAWLGHAGCCIATESPEDCTRIGWHTLNQCEQRLANMVAAEVLEEWRKSYQPKRAQDLFSC